MPCDDIAFLLSRGSAARCHLGRGKQLSPANQNCQHFDLGLPSLQTVSNKCLLFMNYPDLAIQQYKMS
jgi:hypothetical protein